MGSITKWRVEHEKAYSRKLQMEQIARTLGLPEGFEIGYGISWVHWGFEDGEDSLHKFAERVREVSRILGRPPDKSGAAASIFGETPDLEAIWNEVGVAVVDGVREPVPVFVRTLYPKGCKIDPRNPGVRAVPAKIHPECEAALKELEE